MSDVISKIAENATKEAGLHSTTIKDKTYTIELLPATQALAIGLELFKTVLPSFAAWGDYVRKEEVILPEEDNIYTEVSMLLVNQADKLNSTDLVKVLTQKVYSNGVPVDVDREFMGNVGGLVILLEFIIKENIGPFFKEWLEKKGLIIPSLFSQKTQEETST